MRTWTAKVEVRLWSGPAETVEVPNSEYDLLRDQTLLAVETAAKYADDNTDAYVILYKTTKARGTEKDRGFHVYRDRRGQVRYA